MSRRLLDTIDLLKYEAEGELRKLQNDYEDLHGFATRMAHDKLHLTKQCNWLVEQVLKLEMELQEKEDAAAARISEPV